MTDAHVFHFSEDGSIRRFEPHVPVTNPGQAPAVWAIDGDHAPLYWFPRDCPRLSVWADTAEHRDLFTQAFATAARRITTVESAWLPRIRTTRLYRYTFDATDFTPWAEAEGQYVAHHAIVPEAVEPLDDLLGLHVDAGVELRFTPRLGPAADAVLASGLPFSFVRLRNAR